MGTAIVTVYHKVVKVKRIHEKDFVTLRTEKSFRMKMRLVKFDLMATLSLLEIQQKMVIYLITKW